MVSASKRRAGLVGCFALAALVVPGICFADGPHKTHPGSVQIGDASWYGKHHQGKRTASGEQFDPRMLTAAHPTLPLGSQVRVTNLRNGRSVDVTVNDRGPFGKHRRVIDVSQAAAEQIGLKGKGVAKVKVEPIRPTPLPVSYIEPRRLGGR